MTTIPEPGATTRKKRRPKDIGTDAERAVVRWLAANGFSGAERRALRGAEDAGDITGTPGVIWEVKSRSRPVSDEQINAWLTETDNERLNANAMVGVLVVRRPGVGAANAGRWWAIIHASTVIGLGSDGFTDPQLVPFKDDIPVRMLLADVVRLLRIGGYGDPLEVSR